MSTLFPKKNGELELPWCINFRMFLIVPSKSCQANSFIDWINYTRKNVSCYPCSHHPASWHPWVRFSLGRDAP